MADVLAAGEDLDGAVQSDHRETGLTPAELCERAERVIAHQSPVYFAARQGHGDPSRLPIFLVGMANPTAKRLRAILSAHSRVHGARSLNLFPVLLDSLEAFDRQAGRDRTFPESLDVVSAGDSLKVAGWLLGHLQKEDPGADHILDGRGLDAAMVGLVHLVFPKAGMIFCRDDTGVDNLPPESRRLWDSQNTLMDHWRAVLPGRVIEVDRDSLLKDPKNVILGVLNALGLQPEERVAQAITAAPGDPSILSPGAAVGTATAHIRAGRLDQAATVMRALLRRVPEHPAALHLLGVVAFRQGHPDQAVTLMRQSLHLLGAPMPDWEHNLAVVEKALSARAKAPDPAASSPAVKASDSVALPSEDGEAL
ncbi:sulfotransferase [Rhodospirillum sp. A1_3_36]|uniref:sulfotransferase n=1 Tax=Rhodospirillum sp. A1_3_36 TaxID=3391666 RepID=UPI0039A43C74